MRDGAFPDPSNELRHIVPSGIIADNYINAAYITVEVGAVIWNIALKKDVTVFRDYTIADSIPKNQRKYIVFIEMVILISSCYLL